MKRLDQEKILSTVIDILFRILGLIPLEWADVVSRFFGDLLFKFNRKHKAIALENLNRAFGREKSPHEIEVIARQVFANLVRVIFEIGWSLRLGKDRLSKYFKIDGLENIRNAYDKGKGVLVLTAHCGNWELLTVVAAMIEYPLSIVVRPLDFNPLDRFIVHVRSRFGGKIIPKQRSFRAILRSLDRKEMAALLMDQNVDWYEGIFADFFGHLACTSSGLALLALKTGAPVIPVFLERQTSGFRAEFGPEIITIRTGDKRKDMEINTQQYNEVIERFIRRYPEQWFWLHQRWKTKPYCPWPKKK